MTKIQELHPTDPQKLYSISDLDNELVCMTMVRSLGDEYANFTSFLLLFQSLDKGKLKEAFLAEELQRRWCPEATGGDSAQLVSSNNCKYHPSSPCLYCEEKSHCLHKCPYFKQSKIWYRRKYGPESSGKPQQWSGNFKAAQQASTSSPSTPIASSSSDSPQTVSQAMEFAGNASLHSIDPSDPFYPLQLNSNAD